MTRKTWKLERKDEQWEREDSNRLEKERKEDDHKRRQRLHEAKLIGVVCY